MKEKDRSIRGVSIIERKNYEKQASREQRIIQGCQICYLPRLLKNKELKLSSKVNINVTTTNVTCSKMDARSSKCIPMSNWYAIIERMQQQADPVSEAYRSYSSWQLVCAYMQWNKEERNENEGKQKKKIARQRIKSIASDDKGISCTQDRVGKRNSDKIVWLFVYLLCLFTL